MEEYYSFTVNQELSSKRLDYAIGTGLSLSGQELSRSRIQQLIDERLILVNSQGKKSSYKVREGDVISVTLPPPKDVDIKPENIPLDILYEDDDILIINKPKEMVVHPGAGHYSNTLVNGILYHCGDRLSGINGELRPGIVHRIDKNTTGSLIICKNDMAHNHISAQLSAHTIKREYFCLCYGHFKDSQGTVDAPIGRDPKDRKKMSLKTQNGKRAVTHYTVLEDFKDVSFVKCSLETGRTHQIRVHLTSINHPLLGDDTYFTGLKLKYGLPVPLTGQCLHAATLGFIHPTLDKYMEFTAPLPQYFQELLEFFRNRVHCYN